MLFGADEETDATFTLAQDPLETDIGDEGVTRMAAFVAIPSDLAGMRLVAVGVRCYNAATYSDRELALIGVDVHFMVAT